MCYWTDHSLGLYNYKLTCLCAAGDRNGSSTELYTGMMGCGVGTTLQGLTGGGSTLLRTSRLTSGVGTDDMLSYDAEKKASITVWDTRFRSH